MLKIEVIRMGKNVIVHGASTKCTGSHQVSFLLVPPDLQIEVDGLNPATIIHHKPNDNIVPFGPCKYLGGNQCVPVTITRWKKGEPSVPFGPHPSLNMKSYLKCELRGTITLESDGQGRPFFSTDNKNLSAAGQSERRTFYDNWLEEELAKNKAIADKDKPGWLRRRLGDVADFMPYVGTAKAIDEAITGWDIANQEELKGLDRYAGLLPGGRKAKKGYESAKRKILGDGGDEAAEKAAKQAREKAAKEATERANHAASRVSKAASEQRPKNGVVELGGDARDARLLFDQLRGTNKAIDRGNGVFVAKSPSGSGSVTFRSVSKSGEPTVDVHGVVPGVRKVKFKTE